MAACVWAGANMNRPACQNLGCVHITFFSVRRALALRWRPLLPNTIKKAVQCVGFVSMTLNYNITITSNVQIQPISSQKLTFLSSSQSFLSNIPYPTAQERQTRP